MCVVARPVSEAIVVDRLVLEWRLDPSSPHRLAALEGPEQRVGARFGVEVAIVVAVVLQELGIVDQRIGPVEHLIIEVVQAVLPMVGDHRVAVVGQEV